MPSIDLAQAPYFDDFDDSKQFARILFKPAHPVQARELTQLQTIIQSQIDKFGKHIFEEGSIVTGGLFDIDNRVPFVRIQAQDSDSEDVNVEEFIEQIVYSETTGVRAYVLHAESTVADGNVLFIRYLSGSESTDVFLPNEVIRTETSIPGASKEALVETVENTPVGVGSMFSIDSGTVFTHGLFIHFAKQKVVLSSFTSAPSCRVGFFVNFSIITSAQDLSLLDNSQGFLNYASPGADRLKVEPLLSKIEFDDTDSLPEFIELFTIKEGVVVQKFERPIYSIIGDEIAKRTFDESGDYCVRGMGVITREHLDTGTNEGLKTAGDGGDVNLLAVGIEPGLSYVKGYEINTLVSSYVTTDKSTDTNQINSQIVNGNYGKYIIVNEATGSLPVDTGQLISFYDTAGTRVTSKVASSVAPSGTLVGTAFIKSVKRESANSFRIYLFGLSTAAGKYFSTDAKAVHFSNGTNHFFADLVLTDNVATIVDEQQGSLIFPIGTGNAKTIRSGDGSSDTTFFFQRSIPSVTIDLNGLFSISISTPNETFAYGTGTLSDEDKNSIILSLNENKTIAMAGTVAGTSGQKTVTGTNTFFTRLNVGDKIQIADVAGTHVIQTITNDTSMMVVSNFGSSFSAKAYTKAYFVGDIIDLTSKGSIAGVERVVTAPTNNSLSFDLKEMFGVAGVGGSCAASVSFKCARTGALELKKDLHRNNYVKINCSTLSTGLTSPINLGRSDVYKIQYIRKATSAFTSEADGVDVTSHFIFDNGQRDDFYDHASIIPKSSITLTSSDHLLIKFDFFATNFSQGVGYFSVDSYPINDASPSSSSIFTHEIPVHKSTSTGMTFDLRDCLDFRPSKSPTTAVSTTIAGATTNPVAGTVITQESNGIRIPLDGSYIFIDYSYYLSRIDLVTLDKNGKFGIVRGNPATNPITPSVPESIMGIASIYIPPYPSLSASYARILGKTSKACKVSRLTFARHTMRDIGVLKERINNLEYYSTVSLLEKSATDMLVKDADGLDRFKNGFFVDGFVDHSLGATYNSDYKIAIDEKEQVLRPFFRMDSFLYDYIETASSNIQKTGSLITLPYTETVFLEQSKATSYRNIEQSVFRFIGKLELTPDTDVWCDTSTVDKTIDLDFSIDLPVSELEINWGSWEKHITGYNVYQQSGPWTGLKYIPGELNSTAILKGSYSSYADALAAGKKFAIYSERASTTGTHSNGAVETIEELQRTGIKTTATNKSSIEEFGSFVTDVSLVPYIRPQVIRLLAQGLKANTRFHVFFDNENMNDYLTPMVIPPEGPSAATQFLTEGSVWRSNEYGELLGFLRLPSDGKRFRVGTREIIITDTPTNAVDATTYCKGHFVAHGLVQQKQNTIISTKYTVVDQEIFTESRKVQKVEIVGPSCMAYSFMVRAPEGEDGIFLTSAEVFIESLDKNLGVWFEIREMNSAGGITRTQVPYSEVWMKRSDTRLKTSSDGTVPTVVNFECPVFLMNDTQYAFVIHTEGLNPNTYFFVSRIGENDLATGQQVTGRQLTGNVFTTNNNLNWDIVPDIDLKIRFNRAVFNTAVVGTVGMGNSSQEFLTVEASVDGEFDFYGETIVGSDSFTISNVTGEDTIEIDDTIIGSSSLVSAKIVNKIGNVLYTDKHGFTSGETFTITGKDSTGSISSIQYGTATLTSFDRRINQMNLGGSNGRFFVGSVITGSSSGKETTVLSIDNFKYSTMHYNPNYIVFANTNCAFQVKGTRSSNNVLGSAYTVLPHSDFSFETEQAVLSRSNEMTILSGQRSAQSTVSLSSSSNWVSPIVDLSRTNSIFIHNIINDDTTDEDKPTGGNLLNKYISKTVTLAEGQDAEDLLVSLTAYCPPGITDQFPVMAWCKLKHREDEELFAEKSWIPMENSGTNTFSSIANKYDFKAFDFKIPASMMTGSYGEVQYASNGNTFSGFKQFAVKIGLLGTNSALVPKAADLRTIALQM